MKCLALLTGAILLCVGCATDPGAQIAKHNIKSIGVEPRVNARAMRYGESVPGVSSGLAALIIDASKSSEIKRVAAVMQEHKIDVPAMVQSHFVQAVTEIGYEYSESQPDATFVLQLTQYGFREKSSYAGMDKKSIFSSVNAPFAVLHARLVTANGKTIWHGNSQDGRDILLGASAKALEKPTAEIGLPELTDYESNPDKLRQDWDHAIRTAVIDLLSAAKKSR